MKARFVDLPLEQLPHVLRYVGDGGWEAWRGKPVDIDPSPLAPRSDKCEGPDFAYIKWPHSRCCIHMIELDESSLDAAVEQIAKDLKLQAIRTK